MQSGVRLPRSTFRLMPGKVAVPTLIGVLEDKDPKIRGTAARLLGNFPGKRAVNALIHRLGDVDQNVICSAAWALGHLRDPRAADAAESPFWGTASSILWAHASRWHGRLARSAFTALSTRCWPSIERRRSRTSGCFKTNAR